MKNNFLYLFLSIATGFLFANCDEGNSSSDNAKTDSIDSAKSEIPEVKMGNFYTDPSNKANSVVLADTIIYYTEIKNLDPEDDWQQKCLVRLDRKALANIIFNAVYNGRLTAYDFNTDEPMTIEEVKALERKNKRDQIAKMEFTEGWYFNENELVFSKKVNSIMLGYGQKNNVGEVRYYAGIKVYLNGDKKNLNKSIK